MIIWLASYPKSGNTWVRAFISAYYYSLNGEFDFSLLNKIKQYPDKEFFNKEFDSVEDVSREWMSSQKKIIQSKTIKFFKTHSCLGDYNDRPFTTSETTLGGIYIVRDPRNIFTSIKNHFSMSDEEAFKMLTDKNRGLISDEGIFSSYTFISSWSNHYISWIKNNKFRRLIIKYEDLINNTYETFRDIAVFSNTLLNITDGVNKEKLKSAIETTNFKKLKHYEIKEGLHNSVTNFKKWRNIHKENKNLFFNLGPENNWKNKINKEISNKIEKYFEKEMVELKYL